ncbi:T9SS type A sorting domain-containing protein [Chryseobacterium sp. RG1]|uniref:T9SS type A sorting domain-containing protein n=1 Tax=Chryseobacterium tagetis TaxID=2801334 RepID=A0ABS8A8T2_9FLAO|nr:T9SS type A sorting domain-containing protein [Chryseobacterium tagetis]MCA6069360.1 T9SS type A sorting domain-containing protein [Chryseobacterium tagetis]
MKKFFLTIFLCLFFLGYAQGENDNWYFGLYAAANFSNPTNPIALTDNASQWSDASVSDENGNLLFYTDGKSIWNREHQVMQNGHINSALGSSVSYLHDDAIAKDPFNPNKYYIFSTITYYSNGSSGSITLTGGFCSYTVVDMSLGSISTTNGLPLGDVVSGSNSLPVLDANGNAFFSNQVNVVKHADDSSLWVLIPNQNQMYSYKIDNLGFSNIPVISSLPSFNFSTNGFSQYSLNSSPVINGNSNFSNFIFLSLLGINPGASKVMSFDNNTGKITNDYLLDITYNPGISIANEFNKDATVLYIGGANQTVYGVDLINTSTINYYSVPINYPVGTSNIYGPISMRRIKNGDIYFTSQSTLYYLGIIRNADVFNNASAIYDYLYTQGRTVNTVVPLPKIVLASSNNCVQDYTLSSQETYAAHTYHASNTITTNTNYSINASQDIKMKAGHSILLSPNTTINGQFLVNIENCTVGSPVSKFLRNSVLSQKPVRLSLDLRTKDKVEENNIQIYPNPAIDFLNVTKVSDKATYKIYNAAGQLVSNGNINGGRINVSALVKGVYVIAIEDKGDDLFKSKFIKK